MSRADYDAIKVIINDIIGDTQQGNILLKAIKGYFSQKESQPIVSYGKGIKTPRFKTFKDVEQEKEMNDAMARYTEKLNKENKKFKKINEKLACKVNS